VNSKAVVELGAGCGLPSICCCRRGARIVVATDYPDQPLVDNLAFNLASYPNAKVVGHFWGRDCDSVLELNNGNRFDIVILSDVVFSHIVHRRLLCSIKAFMAADGLALVVLTHHRPHLVKEDLNFFDIATDEFGMVWNEVAAIKHPPMFADAGDLDVRTTAHVRILRFTDQDCSVKSSAG
jgi:nicotinamide N-methyltransferase